MKKKSKKVKIVKKLISNKPSEKLQLKHVIEDNPELLALMEKRKHRRMMEARQADSNDSDFFVCIVFESESQKLQFLDAVKDVPCCEDAYVDGLDFCKKFGIKLDHRGLNPFASPVHKRLAKLVMKNHR